ncbi:WecB/TagA/CpsF family glycosyltransferase [Chelatococcus asaccharovorans]|uniref:Exopolysaccharide biosynthesis WecB/TagA/CpsF family protein n=1 Tax=Chelatococcus asaccharovorans TaxID=28210 RepID=A0A2V3UKQ9_9HYPH|nr:WecB/TagA/CpsF family glycosyltransferase [Chelatococcus asaccharovorans]MBS7706473.1 WecB/TagA/CpsF family glycosyltransferase [Chelatococcus asaccharovorans]PXW64884.1 exopolysaccharide biosynthesis WecB/TagA/CpsF family protein [Chelatococcus asaccharovorans]
MAHADCTIPGQRALTGADRPNGNRPIFGIPVTAATSDVMIDELDRLSGAAEAGEPLQVAFLNAHNANLCWENADVAAAFRRGLVLNDGIGLDIATRLLHGEAFPDNLNGTDFVPLYLERTSRIFRIFLLGGTEGVAEKVRAAFQARAPQHRYVGTRHGYFTDREASGVADAIAASGADLVLVALGSPRQELWMSRYLADTGCRIGISVGGLFDFASGTKPRAPALVRRLQCEWVFRLLLEPRRMARRYLRGNFAFLARVARERLAPHSTPVWTRG